MSGLRRLKVLSLTDIRYAMSEEDFLCIAALTHLQELVLDCDEQPPEPDRRGRAVISGLQGFPEGMLRLASLRRLALTGHKGIASLPPGLSQLSELEDLSLAFCSLERLLPSLGQLTRLTALSLEGNSRLGEGSWQELMGLAGNIARFPPELEGLQALRHLNLNSCGLRRVPPVIGSMAALETVCLENNQLGQTAFPRGGMGTELGSLARLRVLNLKQNGLSFVPDVVADLSALRVLDLTSNQLVDAGVPAALTQLSRLEAIGLFGNKLRRVPRVLGGLPSLQEIFLDDNAKLEVNGSLDFIAQLPDLCFLSMGKQEGGWDPASMHFIAELSAQLRMRQPDRQILHISYPGQEQGAVPAEAH